MAKKTNGKTFILISLLLLIGLIPLIKAKPPELELEGDIETTTFERVNGLLK